ncbi:MAG: hypothetical protein ACSLFP_07455, partial [Acidimicrobiales bacterium]
MNGTTIVAQAGFTLLFALALVGWFTRRADDPKEVVLWARSHGLAITAINQATITYYVRLTITLRVIGAVGGLVLGALFDDATGRAPAGDRVSRNAAQHEPVTQPMAIQVQKPGPAEVSSP